MNKSKQDKYSVIFQACWLAGEGGATTNEVSTALDLVGITLPRRMGLSKLLNSLSRRRQIRRLRNGNWCVERPDPQPIGLS